jgi:hypothetical protein
VIVWVILELSLSSRKRRNADVFSQPEDVYSASPPEPVPAEMAPVIKKAPDGQPVAVFPPARQTQPVLGMPDDEPAPAGSDSIYALPVQKKPSRETLPSQPTFPATLPRPAGQAPIRHFTSSPPPLAAVKTEPLPEEHDEVLPISDEEFSRMLQQFEQNFSV